MVKLLSIDSSTSSTGYSIFIDGKYEKSGCIDLKNYKEDKLQKMVDSLFHLIDTEAPDIVVAEEMVVTRNAQAARNLTMLLGAIYGKCFEKQIFWFVLRPTQWRKLIDDGKKPRKRDELKEWSKQKVFEMFGIENVNDDISDSILIGQAYINMWT